MKILIIILLIGFVAVGVGSVALAGDQDIDTAEQIESLNNPIGTQSVSTLIGRIIQAFLGIIGTISLVMFIYAGFLWLTAAGKPAQIQKGQQTMVWASLGILVVFASYAVLKFVFSVFGV